MCFYCEEVVCFTAFWYLTLFTSNIVSQNIFQKSYNNVNNTWCPTEWISFTWFFSPCMELNFRRRRSLCYLFVTPISNLTVNEALWPSVFVSDPSGRRTEGRTRWLMSFIFGFADSTLRRSAAALRLPSQSPENLQLSQGSLPMTSQLCCHRRHQLSAQEPSVI